MSAEFKELIKKYSIETIEVKKEINRTAIGQIIAGTDLFEKDYGIVPSRKVILCSVGDEALQWVCSKRGIAVEIIPWQ